MLLYSVGSSANITVWWESRERYPGDTPLITLKHGWTHSTKCTTHISCIHPCSSFQLLIYSTVHRLAFLFYLFATDVLWMLVAWLIFAIVIVDIIAVVVIFYFYFNFILLLLLSLMFLLLSSSLSSLLLLFYHHHHRRCCCYCCWLVMLFYFCFCYLIWLSTFYHYWCSSICWTLCFYCWRSHI